nr:MAG TPA: hypothetical protein [Caudoviricetes sp.]
MSLLNALKHNNIINKENIKFYIIFIFILI